jgi:competence protein ComEA
MIGRYIIGSYLLTVDLLLKLGIDNLERVREKFKKFFQKFTWFDWLLMGLLCAGLIYLALFGLSFARPSRIPVEYLVAGDGDKEVGPNIWVDVSGAVIRAGVYELPTGSRVKDALMAAGGLADLADRSYVGEVLNLAAIVKDGEKLFIPTVATETDQVRTATTSRVAGSGRININRASAAELDGLTGIGAARAEMIIKNRPYVSVDDLLTKKVLTKGVWEVIRDEIGVY